MLCQRNKFFCDACCGLQEAEKRMKIKHSPNILALHLKRFKYQEDLQKYVKLSYRVAFPFELRLFNTVDNAVNPDRLYELFAIVIHIGRYAVQSLPLMHERAGLTCTPPSPSLSPRDSGPHHGHYITIIKAQGSWVVFDDDSVEAIKESEIPKYYGEGSSGAYVLFYQAVDMDREALGLPPDLPALSAVEAINNEAAVVRGGAAAVVVDRTDPPPDAPGVPPMLKDGEVVASPLVSLPNARGPAMSLKLDLPPPVPALNTSPVHSPLLAESVSKANTPGLSKGAAGFFQSLRHSASSKASMAKETIPPVPPPPLLNGDLYTNGHAHANGTKEKESKEGGGGGNIFRRSLKVAKKREPISVLPGPVGNSPLPSSVPPSPVPPSPNDHRRPSDPQVPPIPTLAADNTNNVLLSPLPLSVASLPPPTKESTLDDTNAMASMSSSWTSVSASAPGTGTGLGPLSFVAPPSLPFTPSRLAQDSELPLPVFPPDRVPSPAGSSSGRTGKGAGTGTGGGADVGNPIPISHSKSNSSEFPLGPDPFSTHNNYNNSEHGQLTPSFPWASAASASVPSPRPPPAPVRAFKLSLGGGETKRPRAAARATEDVQAREREREREKVSEEKMRKTREREEREKRIRLEREREREREEREKEEKEKEREQEQQQQAVNKPQKRASRKMSLTVVGRLGASFGWSKDKDRHTDKDKDKGTTGMSPLPQVVHRGSQHTPSNEAEQDLLPPERMQGYLAIGASPRFNF
jgi:ubiquitin carboxyl-terminal hydrolase 9/13